MDWPEDRKPALSPKWWCLYPPLYSLSEQPYHGLTWGPKTCSISWMVVSVSSTVSCNRAALPWIQYLTLYINKNLTGRKQVLKNRAWISKSKNLTKILWHTMPQKKKKNKHSRTSFMIGGFNNWSFMVPEWLVCQSHQPAIIRFKQQHCFELNGTVAKRKVS